ncbi:MAG: hypothetical protein AAGF60_09525 [Pseudomonadota bacterium]
MSEVTLTPLGIKGGVWSGLLSGDVVGVPQVKAHHAQREVEGVKVTERGADGWLIQVPIPADTIADGVQTYVLTLADGTDLGSFALLAGEGLGHDIRAEMALLRAELDMLKRAFRRHCTETS